jgi:CheY-like chemotaxis protein
MTTTLRRVLLIDDNPADLFLHRRVLTKAGCAERVDQCETGPQALEYLQTGDAGRPPHPELIFLDINMPGMNGWEFLDAYEELPADLRTGVIITMLTVSPSPGDREAARVRPEVSEYLNKPLTLEMLRGVLARHFPDVTCA